MGIAKKYNVLFIDDDDVLLEIYVLWFNDEFNNCFYAKNKGMLDNILEKNKIDVIFCDLRLNKTFLVFNSGYNVIDYINSHYGYKSFWIISGFVEEFKMPMEIKQLVQGIIRKPFDKSDIMRIFGE